MLGRTLTVHLQSKRKDQHTAFKLLAVTIVTDKADNQHSHKCRKEHGKIDKLVCLPSPMYNAECCAAGLKSNKCK